MKPRDSQSSKTSPRSIQDKVATGDSPFQAYLINDKGEELPITEGMVAESMEKAKLISIGAHTGYTKAITDDMLDQSPTKRL